MTVRIVGIGGTRSERSSSLAALRHVLDAAARHGATVELIEVGNPVLPMYEHADPWPAPVVAFAERVHRADGIVWSSPLYHGTVSGLFKNAIDCLEVLRDREPVYLTDKPVGLIAVSAGAQSLQAITTMELMARSLRAWTVPFVVPVTHSARVFAADGAVLDERVGDQLSKLGAEIVRAARRFQPPG